MLRITKPIQQEEKKEANVVSDLHPFISIAIDRTTWTFESRYEKDEPLEAIAQRRAILEKIETHRQTKSQSHE